MAQDSNNFEIATFQYSLVPAAGDLYWGSYEVAIAPKIKIAENYEIGAFLSYGKTMYSFFDTPVGIATESFEEVHLLSAGFFYETRLNDSWGAETFFLPTISSNFAESLTSEDIQYRGAFALNKKWDVYNNEMGLRFGIGYGPLFGKPDFYPILSLEGTFGHYLKYRVGFPETLVDYSPTGRHRLRAMAIFKGSYTNLSDALQLNEIGSFSNNKLAYETLDFGVQHHYRLQRRLSSVVKVGYLAKNSLKIMDVDNSQLYAFNTGNSWYISMGLTININNKLDEKKD